MAFAWSPSAAPDKRPLASSIEPTEVLYDFDGPTLFVSSSSTAPFPLLCYKTDERAGLSQFILAPTNQDVLSRLKTGRMALRSAVLQPCLWVAEVDGNYDVSRFWSLSPPSLPDKVLPAPGVGMYYEHGIINERLSEIPTPFLSVHYRGERQIGKTLPLGVLKGLLDEFYSSVWEIFAPALLKAAPKAKEKTMRKVFNVPVYEPAFASLFVAIERPRLDFAHVRKRPDIDVQRAIDGIEAANRTFLESVEILADTAHRGNIDKKVSAEHRVALEAIATLLPSEESPFDSIEIQGALGTRTASAMINAETGQKIRDAYYLSLLGKRTIEGRVVETSARSFSFILRTGAYREVTCRALAEPVREAVLDIRNGMDVTVSGAFLKRKRRDALVIRELRYRGKVVSAF